MPLVALASLAGALGLLLGQLLSPRDAAIALCIAALAGVVLGLGAPSGRLTLLPLPLLAGLLLGIAATTRAGDCARRLAAVRSLTAVLEHDAAPGDVVPAELKAVGCQGRATLVVSSGRAAAGDQVTVQGRLESGADRAVVRDARLVAAHRTRTLAAIRAAAGRRIDRIFQGDAAMARALVLADMSGIGAERRDRFARAGLVHMLSVSGLHVAIIALALELLASACRLPPRVARVGTVVVLGAYVAAIGAPTPAVRAAVMLALLLLTRVLQRPTSTWAVVAVGGVAPLVQPEVVLDLGWQLSVAGTVALVAGGALATRVIPRRWRGTRRSLARAAVVSVVATVVTAPLVAWAFGRIALLSPITNLIADPVMALLQPVLFIALCVPVGWVERLAADAAHALIAAFDGIATLAAALPFAAPAVMPTVLAAAAAAILAWAVCAACLAREPARALLVALGAVAVIVLEPLVPHRRPFTELHLLDVGQGDAIALRTRAGRWLVIDAGRTWQGGDAGRSVVAPYIAHRGGPVALFAMSHPHADHVGGAASVLALLHPSRFLDPGYVGTSAPYRAALAAASRERIPWGRVHPGDSLVIDEVVVTTLAPDSAWAASLDDANLASAVLAVRIGGVRVLLTGDAEAAEEEWLLAHAGGGLQADVLKVAHHGSATSTTPAFLAAVHPRVALVSVGAGNSYGHPSPEVMRALYASGAEVLRTDRLGTVVVRTDGRSIEIEARGARWRAAAVGP